MLMPTHEISSARASRMSPRRAATIGGVGLLHVAAIYALMTGMTGEIIKTVPGELAVRFFEPSAPTNPQTPPPQPAMARPTVDTTPTVRMPEIVIADHGGQTIHTSVAPPHTPAASDSGALAVASTHTTPPYPIAARTLSHQGTVVLQMTVSPQGDVVAANVIQSSGFAELDSEAVAWVEAHWKYKPAIQGGMPVTSQTQAAVKFDLKQAHR
jgi:periplasmic protein TonB